LIEEMMMNTAKTTTLTSLLLLGLGTSVASAQDVSIESEAAEPWTIGIAPRVGLTVPTSKLGAMVVGGLALDYALPVMNGQLVVALDGSITRPSHDGSISDPRVGGSGNYDIGVTEFKLGLDLIYRIFGPTQSLVPFVGAGPVLHMLRTTATNGFAPGENTAQDTRMGFEVLAGADYRVGPGYVLGEARLVYSGLDHLFTGDSNAGNVMISAGYRLVF
jgi:hypothetical protein